jgi:phosphatidylserine decarboxylase
MRLVPKIALSRLVGVLVNIPLPQPLGRKSVEWFASAYDIDAQEAELPLSSYRTVGAFFTRRLKPGARPIGDGVVHPADALITQAGRVDAQTLLQAKGKTYTVSGLLGGERFGARFEGGAFFTYYLCPTDYHRVHAPVDGHVVWGCHIPGALWPVNSRSVESVDGLFVKNERVIAVIETPKGLAAVVMVAATNVGNMTLAFDPSLDAAGRAGAAGVTERSYDPGIPVRHGEEFGVFNMGSTVIMLYEKGVLDAEPGRFKGQRSQMGESLSALS